MEAEPTQNKIQQKKKKPDEDGGGMVRVPLHTILPNRQHACHVKTKNRKSLSKISQLAAKLLR